tara:strand:+ start:304 stop:582 length:279 start_codon:yes stop_codon:yes gene_type:complete
MTIFDWVNQMLVTKKHWDEFTEDEQKKFSPFIINRWLSMDKDLSSLLMYFNNMLLELLNHERFISGIVMSYQEVKDSISISRVNEIKNMIKK